MTDKRLTDRPPLRPVFIDERGDYVFEDGTRVPDQPLGLREGLIGVLLTVVLVVAIPLLIGFGAYRDVTNDRIRDAEALSNRQNAERIARTRAINEFIYKQCIASEIRDVVVVDQLELALARARATLPAGSALLLQQEQAILDGINALEPENEEDCVPPAATKPKGTP